MVEKLPRKEDVALQDADQIVQQILPLDKLLAWAIVEIPDNEDDRRLLLLETLVDIVPDIRRLSRQLDAGKMGIGHEPVHVGPCVIGLVRFTGGSRRHFHADMLALEMRSDDLDPTSFPSHRQHLRVAVVRVLLADIASDRLARLDQLGCGKHPFSVCLRAESYRGGIGFPDRKIEQVSLRRCSQFRLDEKPHPLFAENVVSLVISGRMDGELVFGKVGPAEFQHRIGASDRFDQEKHVRVDRQYLAAKGLELCLRIDH